MRLTTRLAMTPLLLLLGTAGCYTTTTTASYVAEPQWARYGTVDWVRQVVHRQEGNPAAGAAAGAVIGAIMGGGRGPGALFGAVGGAAVGAAASSGVSETVDYEVAVRFQDGAGQIFVYRGYAPFGPGQPVVLTPRGLEPAR